MTDRVYPSSKPNANGGAAAAPAAPAAATTAGTTANPPSTKPQLRQPYRPKPQYHNRHHRRSSRNLCCCCCFWSFLILIAVALLAAIAGAAVYILYRPHRPEFTLTSVRIAKLNLTTTADFSTSHLATLFNLTLTSENPNNHLTFSYDPFTLLLSTTRDVQVANGSIPAFTSATKNSTFFRSVLSTSQDLDVESVKSLRSDLRKQSGVALRLQIDTEVKLSMGKLRSKKVLQLRASKFLKFQEAKIQELSEDVPKGHIPRTMTVHFRGELTRKVAPGDVVKLSGIFLPIPYTGFRAMRAGLVADTYLEAMSITHTKKKYEDYELIGDEEEQVARLAEDGNIYEKLARSLAPEIYGHEDIKKALLLLLVGAPHRKLKDGMKIRGDLHICLMGDPGVAKSQLLKHIINVAPRGVYTTGKGSSGVGLTAAVQKDPVTNEMVLEGGALVLADMGICAIDEFDKMDELDRTAIHEVMEQQTVSIAKAGITTSLNARTAVLAAANPAWGRYDLRRTPAENINLPPALLSRFDLLWLILDRADMDSDLEMARHVVYVHQNKESPALGFTPLEPSVIRAYISAVRRLSPSVPQELEEYIASAYSSIRQEEAKSNAPHSYTTVRTLLSILRISAAIARLRHSETVAQSDVDEALRLMHMSKFSLYSDDRQKSGLDPIGDIYSILRDESETTGKQDVSYAHALNLISRKGYSEAQLKQCLEEYANINVWQINPISFDIRFIDAI